MTDASPKSLHLLREAQTDNISNFSVASLLLRVNGLLIESLTQRGEKKEKEREIKRSV